MDRLRFHSRVTTNFTNTLIGKAKKVNMANWITLRTHRLSGIWLNINIKGQIQELKPKIILSLLSILWWMFRTTKRVNNWEGRLNSAHTSEWKRPDRIRPVRTRMILNNKTWKNKNGQFTVEVLNNLPRSKEAVPRKPTFKASWLHWTKFITVTRASLYRWLEGIHEWLPVFIYFFFNLCLSFSQN
jgi:hypothetical protein